ncbi:MAG: metallophosphoesterase family protein, partial [Deltaproteobacteria bacterium]|nr:metallophosphoesterase family protein [Deltaproteobacteria bacterium]
IFRLDIDPRTKGISAVISGHTHRPSFEKRDGVIYLNPGSATHPRHNFPESVCLIYVNGRSIDVSFIELNYRGQGKSKHSTPVRSFGPMGQEYPWICRGQFY